MIWNGCQGAGFGTVGGLLEPKLMEGRKRNSFKLEKNGRKNGWSSGLPPVFLEKKHEKSHRKKVIQNEKGILSKNEMTLDFRENQMFGGCMMYVIYFWI